MCAANSENYISNISAYDLPESSFLSNKALGVRSDLRCQANRTTDSIQDKACSFTKPTMAEVRQQHAEQLYLSEGYQSLRNQYQVDITNEVINGVAVEVFTPAQGILPGNRDRLLVNLHGGNFELGAGTVSHQESIPVASLGGVKVISIDYSLAPEHHFPAATEDVASVYQSLINDYNPKAIGIFGASAGGVLVAQSVAWFIDKGLPLPGALAMISGAASPMEGDSLHTVAPIVLAQSGVDVIAHCRQLDYFKGVDMSNPLVTPAESNKILRAFPPCFLASSTRDFLMSSVLASHRQLAKLGVGAELYIWDGLEHAFHYDHRLPESYDLHTYLLQFFNKNLSEG